MKLSLLLYQYVIKFVSDLRQVGDTNLNWVYFIRTILNECGFTYIWETENVNNKEWLKCVVKQRLLD
jgi:hypothetical protein